MPSAWELAMWQVEAAALNELLDVGRAVTDVLIPF
jgi:hypothetical protein